MHFVAWSDLWVSSRGRLRRKQVIFFLTSTSIVKPSFLCPFNTMELTNSFWISTWFYIVLIWDVFPDKKKFMLFRCKIVCWWWETNYCSQETGCDGKGSRKGIFQSNENLVDRWCSRDLIWCMSVGWLHYWSWNSCWCRIQRHSDIYKRVRRICWVQWWSTRPSTFVWVISWTCKLFYS